MIRATGLALSRGGRDLFAEAEFCLYPGQKVAVVGRNGSGKSSLFALLRGELEPDRGRLSRPSTWRIAAVAQGLPSASCSALRYAMDGDVELVRLAAALDRARTAGSLALAELEERYAAAGGPDWQARAARVLHGLGFDPEQQQRPVDTLSGGWRMRLALARALLEPAEVLLLDEPTNHLDLDAVLWLSDWLRHHPALVLLIAHDRAFLDAVAEYTLYLDGHGIRVYSGNYSAFARQRNAELVQRQAEAAAIARRRAQLEGFIRRFGAKASKARQARSRAKMLARLGEAPTPPSAGDVELGLKVPRRLPPTLLSVRGAAVGYAEQRLLSGIELGIQSGVRIGILGRNGAGKSTLMKLLAGVLAPLEGERIAAADLEVAYFAQDQVERLDPAATPLELLARLWPEASDQERRDWLGAYGYSGALATEALGARSGGERARLALASLLCRAPNLLLLDEPTNHLDLAMREALARALADYAGAVVLVAHDRALLEACCDQWLIVGHGSVRAFDGDLDDYAEALAAGRARGQASANGPASVPAAEARRRRLKQLRSELRRVELEMDRARRSLSEQGAALLEAAARAPADTARITALADAEGAARAALHALEERWLELMSELEGIDARD